MIHYKFNQPSYETYNTCKSSPELYEDISKIIKILAHNTGKIKIPFHLKYTSDISRFIAKERGLNEYEAAMAGLLHDIGKFAIPTHILDKPGALTASEKKIMDKHPELGYQLIDQFGLTNYLDPSTLESIKYHHKHLTKPISPITQTVVVADCLAAMTERRTYKMPVTPNEAIQNIIENSDFSMNTLYSLLK